MKTHRRSPLQQISVLILISCLVVIPHHIRAQIQGDEGFSFELSFPASAHPGPMTGRAYIVISETGDQQAGRLSGVNLVSGIPIWGKNFHDVNPGDGIVINENVFGFPYERLSELPPGDYFVQGVISVYSKFERSDGHTIWIHDDQWEGQQWNTSPGNLYSSVERFYLQPSQTGRIPVDVNQIIPPIKVPPDTKWVKRIKFRSDTLTEFWGRPIYLGATVLLPRGYDEHPNTYYPVNYYQGHFSLGNPHGFRDSPPGDERGRGRGGYEFYQYWNSDEAPRMLSITFQHPTPYYDDSYAVNSANHGPYGNAIMQELIPALEEQFRIIREPFARVLYGGSTGGWEVLALQIYNPDFFGGAFSLCPDPVDFRYFKLINIYQDENAFKRKYRGIVSERPEARDTDGQVRYTMRQMAYYERVLGEKLRSGGQFAAWEATYSPVGDDGFPKPLWNWDTGEIDHDVAETWRKYDFQDYLQKNWSWIGEKLHGKLHIYTGDMDTYYLNNATVLLEEFLESTSDPYYDGVVEYGDRQPHCWGPRGREIYTLFRDHIIRNAPPGSDTSKWIY